MHAAQHTNMVAQIPSAEPFKQVEIGRIRNVGSSVATIAINNSVIRNNQLNLAQIGTILKIVTHKSVVVAMVSSCLLYTSPSPRDATLSRMPSSA